MPETKTETNPLESPVERAVGHVPLKTDAKTPQDKGQDRSNTAPKTLKRRTVGPTPVSELSSDVSDASVLDVENEMEKLVPHRRERPDVSLSESDLKREQERLGKIKIASEMLQTGWSVREVSQELKLPKSLIEKLSKKLGASESRPRGYGYREEYLQRPYRRALQESEDEDEDLVEWARKENVKIMKMTIQMGMMRRNGLLGSDDGASTQTQKIDLNALLIAKAVGGSSTKEMAEMLALLKSMGLIGEPKVDDFMAKYSAMEGIKESAVAKHSTMQAQAFAAAKSETDRNFTREIINKVVDTAAPFVKNLTLKPTNIPPPTPESGIPGPLMPPSPNELESLSLPSHVPIAEAVAETVETLPSDVGYSNITPRGKTQLGVR